ncbi:DUF5336 domain-containing protein [Amycolatopsis suaedae]|uniref:DUF5336 domain-containing protein n=1 Tax=Amycolatopsis suaedae TaxID=2510978 RepID=A0A4Q7J6U3_9PSEU|nr:DUF5336 domain-containing protein [Amycolatopsis suaedae]RZQ62859.1 hypothetical protein EWH70_18195 [Amycolatopsis suaedae]
MSFPSSGPGYPQQGGGQPNPQAPGTGGFPQAPHQQPVQGGGPQLTPQNLSLFLALAVAVLGLVNYFISFSSEAGDGDWAVRFLLIGGLVSALRALPNGPKALPFGTLLSVAGGLFAIHAVVRVPEGSETPGILTVLMILGILQLLVAVAAVLFEHDVISMPAPKPQQPQYAQPQYGQPGGQGQQPQQGGQPPLHQPTSQYAPQPPQGPTESGPFSQPTQYSSPVTPPSAPPSGPPAPQATQYAPQQGQFYSQPEPGQGPGTPPGGTEKP